MADTVASIVEDLESDNRAWEWFARCAQSWSSQMVPVSVRCLATVRGASDLPLPCFAEAFIPGSVSQRV
jgi:hypothetical protein